MLRNHCYNFTVIFFSTFIPIEYLIAFSPIFIGLVVVRVESNGVTVVSYGFVVVYKAAIGVSSIVIGGHILQIEVDGL